MVLLLTFHQYSLPDRRCRCFAHDRQSPVSSTVFTVSGTLSPRRVPAGQTEDLVDMIRRLVFRHAPREYYTHGSFTCLAHAMRVDMSGCMKYTGTIIGGLFLGKGLLLLHPQSWHTIYSTASHGRQVKVSRLENRQWLTLVPMPAALIRLMAAQTCRSFSLV